MKKITSLLLLCFAINANAATSITSSSVAGHWTVTGSPYDVYNDIQVIASQSLIIDPGVNVVFHGPYRLLVYGVLNAAGTSTQQINFAVSDTLGFTTDDATSAGGWHGIQFFPFGGTGTDNSTLQFCNIANTKFSPADASVSPELHSLHLERNIVISNCNIHDNRTTTTAAIDLCKIFTITGQVVELSGCNIYNNFSHEYGFMSFNVSGGQTYVHDCKIYQNKTYQSLFYFSWSNALFNNNDVYQNNIFSTISGMGIVTNDGNATMKGNKIHDNIGTQDGAIFSGGGFVDIIGNLLCNNQHTSGTCGIVDGGGALNLSWNSAIDHAHTFYNIKNNIIANNYSPFEGGAIKLYNTSANITNNQIVNNVSSGGGSVYLFDNDTSTYVIKNNIFYGNAVDNAGTFSPAIDAICYNSSVLYEYNWTKSPTAVELQVAGTGYTVTGDTTKNIVGLDPGMVSSTTTTGVATSALTANFDLSTTSACINKGDTTGVSPLSTDYAGNVRIYSTKIDIGAYEHRPPLTTLNASVASSPLQLYPNPAKNQVFVTVPEANGKLLITDITGRLLAEKDVTNTLTYFDIHTMDRGIYLLTWDNGSETKITQKIVVE